MNHGDHDPTMGRAVAPHVRTNMTRSGPAVVQMSRGLQRQHMLAVYTIQQIQVEPGLCGTLSVQPQSRSGVYETGLG